MPALFSPPRSVRLAQRFVLAIARTQGRARIIGDAREGHPFQIAAPVAQPVTGHVDHAGQRHLVAIILGDDDALPAPGKAQDQLVAGPPRRARAMAALFGAEDRLQPETIVARLGGKDAERIPPRLMPPLEQPDRRDLRRIGNGAGRDRRALQPRSRSPAKTS